MKKQSRLIVLLLAGTLGLTPFSGFATVKERVQKRLLPGEELSGVPEIKEMAGKGKELWQTGKTKIDLGELTVEKRDVAIGAAAAAAIVAAIVGTIVKKVRVMREVSSLRRTFPTYPIYALELAAIAKLVGFKRWIALMYVQNIAKFRNPRQEIRLLATDDAVVDAIAYVTNYKNEYVRKVFANPGLFRLIVQ